MTTGIKKGSILALSIEKTVYQGQGLAQKDGLKIFVPNTLPGDEVEALITLKKRDYGEAKVLSFIKRSESRTESPCPHFPTCGGCQFIDVDYIKQLALKESVIQECAAQFVPEVATAIQPMIPCATPFFYRNKMEFAFGDDNGQLTLGLKKRGTFSHIVPVSNCQLQSPLTNTILKETVDFFQKVGLKNWNYRSHTGTLRHLMVRQSKTENTTMLMLLVSEKHPQIFQEFADYITKKIPSIVSIYIYFNAEKGDTPKKIDCTLLFGETHITERLGPIVYKISPLSFFQTNTTQANVLYQNIKDACSSLKTHLQLSHVELLDLYCGTGSIGLFLSDIVENIMGIEEIPQAIEDAKKNAENNAITNATFVCGTVKKGLENLNFKPNIIVTDPPRSGMNPKDLTNMIALNPDGIIYVSCNPMTLCRDLQTLTAANYEVKSIQPIDMFPHTFHMECVTQLIKKKS